MVSTTRSATCLSDHSRSGVPSVPRKYFWARMLVALKLHPGGHLDAELLEGDRPGRVVGDAGVPALPRDGVVGVLARRGELPVDADAHPLRGDGHERTS